VAACGLVVGVHPVVRSADPIKLTATVGPGYTITLKNGTQSVSRLKVGAYTITVRDRASNHNFHLYGNGLNRSTTVSAVTTKTWNVTFRPGTYTYVCDPHPGTMKRSFQVVR
jgi:plastocyanin